MQNFSANNADDSTIPYQSAEVVAQVEPPGLPGLRTWPAVYIFVVSAFLVYVILLTLLSRMFS